MTAVTVRAARADDIPALAALETLCFSHPWSADDFAKMCADLARTLLVAEADGAFCGYIAADTVLDEQKLQLALAKLEGRENAAELRAEATARVAELREKLAAVDRHPLSTRRLLRAFPDMKSLNYAETLAATRTAVIRLRELAAAAK